MSDYDDGSLDLENGILDTEASEADSIESASPRPPKRRRIHPDDASPTADEAPSAFSDDFDDSEAEEAASQYSDFSDKLPSPRRPSAEHSTDQDPKSKYKSFVPRANNRSENMFVTQLTQPYSSPERIRAPRWQKPNLQPPAPPDTSPIPPNQDTGHDDEGLNAAIAASLDSFEKETRITPSMSKHHPTVPDAQNNGSMDVSFELDGIPDDAFDSSPVASPAPTRVPRPSQPRSSMTRTPGQPTGLRQTTLFDTGRNLDTRPSFQLTQSPPNKNEPPTQHKLDDEASNTWVYPTNLGKIRDYQFNITQKGLFHNLLVALPTGLGKTFIAATIMLNWLRWTKSSQVVFVAPTKPLVSQQISACFGVAGIPRSQTTMLTGEAAPGIRAEQWQSKRVFFMTPQTLMNDLKGGAADPKRFVLIVVDEAHRATGNYAYVEVVRFLRRFNQSFRVLALTATPGSTVESVQAVIDGLDIAKVEIRTEQSLDIREYVHSRNTEVQTFENSEEMVLCMDLFSRTLQPLVDQLRTLNAYWGRDPMGLTAYGLTKARQQWMGSDAGKNAGFGLKGKVNSIFTVLASLAHAIDLLKYHGITPFYRHLVHFQSNTDGQKGGKYANQVVKDDHFKKLMNHLKPWSTNPEFIGHPKLEYLKHVVLNHFMDAGEGQAANPSQSATRIMIFAHFRDSAEEITRVLNRFKPMIRPHVFVGQTSAKGSDGMDQKTQLSIIQKFKEGTYNTIVATSIGEEGLDIGEVDLIVCYDSSASPIRMLQRMGRTGRKRTGNIVLLLMQGKEEESYIKAKDNYEKMQQMIASGTRFTFHDDRSPRILPPGVRPVPDKREIDIPPENSQSDLPEPKKRGRAPKRPPKKFHMPDDVETGFTKASDINGSSGRKNASKPPAKSRKRSPKPEIVTLPFLDEVLLTPAQQSELQSRYCNIGDTSPQLAPYPRNDAFPRLQLVPRPTRAVKHGSATKRLIKTLQRMENVGDDCEQRYRRALASESRDLCTNSRSPQQRRRSEPNAKSAVSTKLSKQDRPEWADDNTQQTPLAFTPSQSQFDQDDDLELPDIDTIFNDTQPKPTRKKNRFVFDEDSDD